MADIEATFEDRYTKLKLVAIKLKKKTVDQVSFAATCCCCSTFLEFNIFLCKFLEFEPLEHKFPTNSGNRFRWS